jgi:hypothetical protein
VKTAACKTTQQTALSAYDEKVENLPATDLLKIFVGLHVEGHMVMTAGCGRLPS